MVFSPLLPAPLLPCLQLVGYYCQPALVAPLVLKYGYFVGWVEARDPTPSSLVGSRSRSTQPTTTRARPNLQF